MKKTLKIFLILLILADAGFSFMQFYNTPLDFDMPGGIVPSNDVKMILESPLGIKVFEEGAYPNPNRFFSHWMFYEYFNTVPALLQHFTSPIQSVYLSCAIIKLLIQLGFIYLLALLISGAGNRFRFDFIVAAVLVIPMFQVNGYRSYMGIIDPFTTYTFFYALPLSLLVVYFLPLIKYLIQGQESENKIVEYLIRIPLAVVVPLSGHLNPGIVLVFSLVLIVFQVVKNFDLNRRSEKTQSLVQAWFRFPKIFWLYLVPVGVLSLYSLFIMRYDSINNSFYMPLVEMYSRLPKGLFLWLTQKPGLMILLLVIIFNLVFIKKKFNTGSGAMVLKTFKWIGLFALIYILLLPLGGYREHRPNVIRYDTVMPITISLIFYFGWTSFYLIQKVSHRQKRWYIPIVILVLVTFTNADRGGFSKNDCEIIALEKIAKSDKAVVPISSDCYLLSWKKIDNAKESELSGKLLHLWGITDEEKLYYNQ